MSTPCRGCQCQRCRTRFTIDAYSILECPKCSLVFLDPFPSSLELTGLYDECYFASPRARDRGYLDYAGERDNYLRTFRGRLRHVSKSLPPQGRMLEIGCAYGYFLEVLLEAGWTDLHGIDLSASAIEQAKSRLGHRVELQASTVHDMGDAAPFDAVFMWDVIEHLPDPWTDVRQVRRLLADDGVLILETQDVSSFMARACGRRWHMYKVPEHLFHFNPCTIRALLERCGFKVEAITKSWSGKYVSGAFIRERAARYGPLFELATRALAKPLQSVYINPMDEMIVVARPAGAFQG